MTVLYRLGMPVFQADGECAACGRESDRWGDHAVGCASQCERIARHNHLRDALYHTAVSAHLAPLREERALLPGGEMPAYVVIPNFAIGGKHMAIDVGCGKQTPVPGSQLVDRACLEPGTYAQVWGSLLS